MVFLMDKQHQKIFFTTTGAIGLFLAIESMVGDFISKNALLILLISAGLIWFGVKG